MAPLVHIWAFPVTSADLLTLTLRRREKKKKKKRGAVAVIVDPPEAGVMIKLAKRGKELEINPFLCSHINRSGRRAMTS